MADRLTEEERSLIAMALADRPAAQMCRKPRQEPARPRHAWPARIATRGADRAAPPVPIRPDTVTRHVSVQQLLEWAFGREHARLDFDELASTAGSARIGVGMEYILMERHNLGCRVDGGGRSHPHDDADIVASEVAALPEGHGGRGMALWIAELARAGTAPDWMPDARPRALPEGWHTNRYGSRALTRDAAALGEGGWPAQPRRNRKGVILHDPVLYCPLRWTCTASQIAAARRAYLGWHGALRHLQQSFRLYGGLTAFEVTDALPPAMPWKKDLDRSVLAL